MIIRGSRRHTRQNCVQLAFARPQVQHMPFYSGQSSASTPCRAERLLSAHAGMDQRCMIMCMPSVMLGSLGLFWP